MLIVPVAEEHSVPFSVTDAVSPEDSLVVPFGWVRLPGGRTGYCR